MTEGGFPGPSHAHTAQEPRVTHLTEFSLEIHLYVLLPSPRPQFAVSLLGGGLGVSSRVRI